MILSDDHPPPLDLSPSDHCNHQKFHDLKISCGENAHTSVFDVDLFVDLDANNPQSSFSIREYVFKSRIKNIACNWPFSHKTLQICLQHEVKNILPPFQSLESLRNNPSNEEILSSCNGKSKVELTLESRKSMNLSQTHLQQDPGQTKSKKPVIGPSRKTETETAMASKICPVCKIFSSSSNTTLNAHIDQCLSGESTMKGNGNNEVIIKHKVKHRKMRLMVDIYKTAPHCTVEELDARNGSTSWANNSSFPAQEIEFEATNIVDHEGDVHSDSNRTKVQILSVPKADNNNDGSQKKRGNSGKVFLGNKKSKNQDRKHDHKYLKQSKNSKKSSFEVKIGPGENCNKVVMNKDDLPIVRPPWACSKRTSLSKKNLPVASDESFSKSGSKPLSSSFTKTGILSQQNSQETESLTPSKLLSAKKRSPLLTKSSFKHFKKRGTILHNSCEDPSISCLVKGSDVSRKTASKINLKRKFSALKRCQDSLKHKSWVKEHTSGKASCESMNLLEVKKNEKMEICRQEESDSSMLKIADLSCDIESVENETRLNKEQVSTMQVCKSCDNMFESRERGIDVIDDIERQQPPPYHDMSDSPISTVSNPSLARSDSDKFSVRFTPKTDEKHALVALKSSDYWRSNGQSQSQSQTTSFKNDYQPCCCSRKEISPTYHDQSTLLKKHDVESSNFRPHMFSVSNFPPPPLIKLPPYRECDSAAIPSKPFIRLMGKNLTVVNTDEDKVNHGQFPDVQNDFKPHHSTFHPPNSFNNHAFDTMFQRSTYPDYYDHGSPHVGPMNSLAFNTGGFQACSPFMEIENIKNLAKWNCKPATGP